VTQASRSHGAQPSRSNKQINRQSRKVLGQHYRAKYGVK
jgi:hypothetical protein